MHELRKTLFIWTPLCACLVIASSVLSVDNLSPVSIYESNYTHNVAIDAQP